MNVLSTRPTISQGSIKTFTLDMDFSALSDSCVRSMLFAALQFLRLILCGRLLQILQRPRIMIVLVEFWY